MKAHAFVHAIPAPYKVVHSIERTVYCVHCYHTLGIAQTAEERNKLQREHTCRESLLTKKPATPVPYN